MANGLFLKDFFQDLVRTFQDLRKHTHTQSVGFLGSFVEANLTFEFFGLKHVSVDVEAWNLTEGRGHFHSCFP